MSVESIPGALGPALLLSVEKINTSHRGRDAYVYVRQSTPAQMIHHTESLARQYELRERAVALGWPGHQVVVIDADLGRSGAQSAGRLGFKELVADVGLGKVGLVLGIEVSRLARNNADWYQLLDLCALTDTLIADADGVYHRANFNDRLVLGLKGTMSEAELHLIRSRLTAGLKHKAGRGELRQGLPVGLDYDEDDKVVITADEAVREVIVTVFRRFDELGSARQVLISLREDHLLLPRRRTGSTRITWADASYPAVHDFLTNPAYAGAFVFGRTRTEKRVDPDTGQVLTRDRVVPRDQWEVLIPEHHPGFITWDKYEANTARLRSNWRGPRDQPGGAVREGRALLQGLLRCARCGRIMQTGYSGSKGNCPRYVCARAKQLYAGEHVCQSIGGIRAGEHHPRATVRGAGTGRAVGNRPGPGRGRRPSSAQPRGVRARRRARPLRSPTGASPVQQRRTGEPAGRPHPGEDPGRQTRRGPRRGGRPGHPACPPPGRAHRRRACLDQQRRRRCAGGVRRAYHHTARAQAADPCGDL